MTNRLPSLLAIALAAACARPGGDGTTQRAESAGPAAALGDTLRIMRGQSGTVDGGRLAIRFDSAGADSRCPANVQCVWAGDIAVMLTFTAGSSTSGATLHTGLEPRNAVFAGYRIDLVAVDPYPGTEPPNARLAQVAALRVTRP